MGVYISGMEMPKNCAWCRFLQSTDPIPKRELFCGIDTTNNIHDYKPDKGCPLVPVPPHGDLIDKNGIKWIKEEFEERCHNDRWTVVEKIAYKYQVDKLPTIIPASEEGE